MTYDGGRQTPADERRLLLVRAGALGTVERAAARLQREPRPRARRLHPRPEHPSRTTSSTGRRSIPSNNPPATTRGGVYAPFQIERFTRVDGDTLTISYTMSTWNPYTVVRMRSAFAISSSPEETRGTHENRYEATRETDAPSPRRDPVRPWPRADRRAPIPSTFFGVAMVNAKDAPAVPMGTVAHGDFAWQRIEQQKGVFDFALFDAYVGAAQSRTASWTVRRTRRTWPSRSPPGRRAGRSRTRARAGPRTAFRSARRRPTTFRTGRTSSRPFSSTTTARPSRTSASTSSGTSSTWRSGGPGRTPRWSRSRRPRIRSSTRTRIRFS